MVKDIKGYEGYYTISYDGTITNVKTGYVLKHSISIDGYLYVSLYKNGVRRTHRSHRLVAEAFVTNPNPLEFDTVLHKDNNKLNIHPSNLMWGTVRMNNIQAVQDGLRNVNIIPCIKKDYVIKHSDGSDATPFYFSGMSTVVNLMGYGTVNTGYSILHRGSRISQGPYNGCRIEIY